MWWTYEVAEPTYVSFHSRSEALSVLVFKNAQSVVSTVAQLLQALECDLELVWICESCRIVEHLHPEQRHNRHEGGGAIARSNGKPWMMKF